MLFNVLFPPFQIINRFSFVLSQTCLTMTKFMENILTPTISNKCAINFSCELAGISMGAVMELASQVLGVVSCLFLSSRTSCLRQEQKKRKPEVKVDYFFPVKQESGCRILEERNWRLAIYFVPNVHSHSLSSIIRFLYLSFEFLQSKWGLGFG